MVAAAVIGGAALTAGVGAISASNASSDQQQADQSATQLQQNEFNTVQSETAPERQLGYGATGILANLYGEPNPTTGAPATAPNYSAFTNSPGYQFAVKQANQATNRQAAASGNLYSSNTLQTIGANNAGYASEQYNNYVQSLMQQAGLGNAANNTSVQGTGNATTQAANLTAAAGAANASGIYNTGAAFSTAFGGLTNPNSPLMPNNSGTGAFQPYGAYGADSGGAASGNLTYAQQVAAGF